MINNEDFCLIVDFNKDANLTYIAHTGEQNYYPFLDLGHIIFVFQKPINYKTADDKIEKIDLRNEFNIAIQTLYSNLDILSIKIIEPCKFINDITNLVLDNIKFAQLENHISYIEYYIYISGLLYKVKINFISNENIKCLNISSVYETDVIGFSCFNIVNYVTKTLNFNKESINFIKIILGAFGLNKQISNYKMITICNEDKMSRFFTIGKI